MAWEWKEDPPVKVQAVSYSRNDLSSLANMAWIIVIANAFFILGFGLLVGFATNIVNRSYVSNGNVYFESSALNYGGGYIAGAVILSLSAVAIFVMGIVLLAVRKPYFQDQGLVTATGVVSILGGLFVVSGILALVIISKINQQKRGVAIPPPPAYGPPSPPPVNPQQIPPEV